MNHNMVFKQLRKARRKAPADDYIVALDVGTEFVKALIAKVNGEDLEIVGVGRFERHALWRNC
jgi:cell division ATPase FtsA